MSEHVDPFSSEEPIQSEAVKRGMTREEAIAWGRRLGEDEANRRNETGILRAERIQRAADYAAWDYDGRPRTESSSTQSPVVFRPDFKGGK